MSLSPKRTGAALAAAAAALGLIALSPAAHAAPAAPAAAVAPVAPGAVSAPAAQSDCPSGDVCIYPDASFNSAPQLTYYAYGTYNLSNMYGVHRIYNNQTGGATMRTCTGYNGDGCQGYLPAGWYIDKDLTPINSITLEP
ncbi:hypothetical protein [Kitasatospora sp. LaBMicrA B282]|uniref:hypothetical protein n=1 Tax=Kitasatospora sp. LaBMicrA B282 TaxID=3420949 RepID=UPI003D0D2280